MSATGTPEGLADTPPGPALCALLAGLTPDRLPNDDVVDALQAWRRLRSYADAHELAMMAEVGRCDPHAPSGTAVRLVEPDPECGREIATALTLTELTAWREHALAEMLVHRLPDVHAALACGDIDRGKARVFADLLEPLSDAQIARVCAALLPTASGLTTGQLRARMQRMVIAIDPDAAQRRYRKALSERRVVCYLDDTGTATLSAIGLDPGAAQAACERLDALARDVRAAGHPDPLPRIRADLATALLDGSVHALSHDQIIATMLARAAAAATDDQTEGEREGDDTGHGNGDGAGIEVARRTAGGPDDGGSDDGRGDCATGNGDTGDGAPGDGGAGDSGLGGGGSHGDADAGGLSTDDLHNDGSDLGSDDPCGERSGTDDPAGADSGTDDPGGADSGTDGPGGADSATDGPGGDDPGTDDPGGDGRDTDGPGGPDGPDNNGPQNPDNGPAGSAGPGGRGAERARPGIEVRVRLSTLLGHDDHPGEIPGLGPILAPTARAWTARLRHAEWRFAITDPDGYLILAGTTRRRPPRQPEHPLIRQAHGGVVELQVPADLLEQLAVHPPAGWAPLIADLTTQYAQRDQLHTDLDEHPDNRLPHSALRRHVEIRDRTCSFPGCRRSAHKAQQDHTEEHQHGGPSVTDNLGPLCILHHAIKTTGRWRLEQPAPGSFRWQSPLKRIYCTRGEPVCPPVPEPLPEPVGPEPAPAPPSRVQREADALPTYPTAPAAATVPVPSTPTTGRGPPDDEPPF
ncbi:HNH endonuclease signature motif containing protein [Pseudonocardia parietis]|uniref:DUF222 domain-containing protein n=1 Tax=Pseudonocardia parietis TaxID=570936 RepID=A0ABS4VSK2_9PSEU|nr:HNH endonuclease signature motif containing protein [Pseudonocardia parietis]MBP2366534.1 hypothetical protein [Pseudonocardia parietis]